MIKALLFDMDGTLIHTSTAVFEAYKEACKKYGLELKEEHKKILEGKHFKQFLKEIFQLEDEELAKKIQQHKKEIYADYLHMTKPVEHIFELLKVLHKNYKTALVTTASKETVKIMTEKYDLDKYFDIMITGDDVTKRKPDPQAYEKAAKALNVKSSECLVFEDSESGIKSAENASMQVLDIRG